MAYRIVFTKKAKITIRQIIIWIGRNDSPAAAEKVRQNLLDAIGSLAELPERGTSIQNIDMLGGKHFREIFYKPYRIIYSIADKDVVIHAVVDGRRDMSAILKRLLTH